ncbi:putative bifunctional diguanylate cyclase/phosphodiesterase [Halodesulfovibrio marinisediminis]|nr:EAL domain-containing protein [Halodesulfovibrio marinisediminis]
MERESKKRVGQMHKSIVRLLPIVLLATIFFTLLLTHIDALDLLYSYTRAHEEMQLDEIILGIITFIPISLIASLYTTRKFLYELVQKEKELEYSANHDSMTRLANRNNLLQLLDSLLVKAKRHESRVAVLFIDLDDFKLINDTLGHDAGDALLYQVAKRLSENLRESDILARHGGDEFILLISGIEENNSASKDKDSFCKKVTLVTQRILTTIQKPFSIENQNIYINASIGVSIYPDDGDDKSTLLMQADTAMYRAKEHGRGTYQYFSQDLTAKQNKLMLISNDLRRAIDNKEFVLHYQPIVELNSGRMIGVEALIRWVKDGKVISPNDFIPVAESIGLINPIGDWVLEECSRQLHSWKQENIPLYIAANISGRQLWQKDILEKIINTTKLIGVSKEQLEIEITEGTVIKDSFRIATVFDGLQSSGIKISLDDFGTGYSSLSRLRQMPISKLKIDRSFVNGIPLNTDDIAIVKAIIQMSDTLSIDSLAEGIETEEQWRYLRDIGCQYGQGYYFSQPVPAKKIEELWHDNYLSSDKHLNPPAALTT